MSRIPPFNEWEQLSPSQSVVLLVVSIIGFLTVAYGNAWGMLISVLVILIVGVNFILIRKDRYRL